MKHIGEVYIVVADQISLDDESLSTVLACDQVFLTKESAEAWVEAAETWCCYYNVVPVPLYG